MRKNDEFCVKNEELCSKNEELCVKNEELCIKNGECIAVWRAYMSGLGKDEAKQAEEKMQVSFQWKNPDFLLNNG